MIKMPWITNYDRTIEPVELTTGNYISLPSISSDNQIVYQDSTETGGVRIRSFSWQPSAIPLQVDQSESYVIGYRQYQYIHGTPISLGFLSGALGVPWATRYLTAGCNNSESRCEEHLKEGSTGYCRCGIYVLNSDKDLTGVVATVVGWGAIYLHENGARVQHCRIDLLTLKGTWSPAAADLAIQELGERYQVPVVLGD